ncbi:hypothetical protein J5N97_003701 [Dioscorea zingiberensis]|uniref:Uncharacterized protein n=1 Tax=Dioscorea zingiberensis TaxID=325984 RepID=A0A9D5D768_9LILI|nr:hypothetical protein J5N97_003701 [Dioscorea zingiberensis]
MDIVVEPTSLKESCLEKSSSLDMNNNDIMETSSHVKMEKLASDANVDPEILMHDQEILEISLSSNQAKEDYLSSDYQTPTGNIFDPFAPAPEDQNCAPKKKMLKEAEAYICRKLNFDSCIDVDDAAEEELLLDSVYRSFLELIVNIQIKEIYGQNLVMEPQLEGFETPKSLPLLTGTADTCPLAPMRVGLETKDISLDICKKLEF